MRRNSEKDKKLADDACLLRAWHNWHAEELAEALAGPHRVIATQVVTFLKMMTMTPAAADALLTLMRSHTWADVDADTRFILLHEINTAITRMREKNGMPPIDDPLPDSRENVFLLVKKYLFPARESPAGGVAGQS
jgi:hypothetical protein